MAACIRFTCTSCGFSIDAWDEGNPFYIDEKGKKVYVYHPSEDRALAIGNDEPHLCLDCGKEVKIDSRLEQKACPKCKSTRVVDTYELDGVECPNCKKGQFAQDRDYFCIS